MTPIEKYRAVLQGFAPKDAPPLPPLHQMVINAGEATIEILKTAATKGRLLVPPEVADQRRAACFANRCGFHRKQDDRCAHKKCGCNLRLKRKFAAMFCPAEPSQWLAWKPPNELDDKTKIENH